MTNKEVIKNSIKNSQHLLKVISNEIIEAVTNDDIELLYELMYEFKGGFKLVEKLVKDLDDELEQAHYEYSKLMMFKNDKRYLFELEERINENVIIYSNIEVKGANGLQVIDLLVTTLSQGNKELANVRTIDSSGRMLTTFDKNRLDELNKIIGKGLVK